MRYQLPVFCLAAMLAMAMNASAQQTAAPPPIVRRDFIAQMDAQFGRMDVDRNGLLSRAEIERFEQQRAAAEAQARNEALFDQLDVNKNGQLSAKEFAKLTPEPQRPSAQPMLSRVDSNRDGQISLVEHRAATVANFDRLDSNRDGTVSVDEMKAGGISPR